MGMNSALMAHRYFRIEDLLGTTTAPGTVASQADQLLAINQRLVLTTLHAHALVEEADAARAQAALSERRYRALVDSIAAIVWNADASGWVRFDARWHVMTGLRPRAQQTPADWLEGVHAGDRERVRATWAGAVASGSIYECEHRLYRRDGTTAWVSARAVPILGDDAKIVEWTGLMADITDRKIMDETRERFVGVLGHDLRTPLTAIRLGVDSLAHGPDLRPVQQATLALIRRCTARMQRMIVDVLDFTRGRLGGGIPVDIKPASFGDACRDAVTELRMVHPTRRIDLETEGDLVGWWDTGRVQQVVSNLVGNALEHGADPVEVRATGAADEVVLEIRNANLGPPVPAELLPLLFEPFRRGRQAVDSGGLGLGLYIVSEIVRAHGGTITVTSSAESGTTFTSRWARNPPGAAGPSHLSLLPSAVEPGPPDGTTGGDP
jgi:PAS domain S-box-containing protein